MYIQLQYPKMITSATIQCVWAIQTDQPGCSLRFCLFHTGQTLVASIPRLSLSGLHGMPLCACLVRLLSLVSYLRGPLARIEFAFAVTRLGPPGFSTFADHRSVSTCEDRYIHEV